MGGRELCRNRARPCLHTVKVHVPSSILLEEAKKSGKIGEGVVFSISHSLLKYLHCLAYIKYPIHLFNEKEKAQN